MKLKWNDTMDNSVAYVTSFQNYADRKFCKKCHITDRIFYILILLGLFVAYHILRAILGGSWQTESIVIALVIFNLGLTWKLNMMLKGHISWHKAKNNFYK